MKELKEIYHLTFTYKLKAIIVILSNLLYVIFNLVSLILFIPFLQLIFSTKQEAITFVKPIQKDGFVAFFEYCAEMYQYWMKSMVAHDPKQALMMVCISVFIAFTLKNVFRYIAIYHQSYLRMAVVRDIRNRIFVKSLNLPLSFYTEERKGDIMARMNSDVGEIEIAVVSMLELIFREPIAIIINIAALVYWSPQLTLISFILLPISAFVISRIGKSLKRTAKDGQEQMGLLFSSIEENLGAIRIIKAFNAIPYVSKTFAAINLRHQQLITKTFRKRDISSPLNEVLGSAVMIGIVWFGGIMILDASQNNGMTGEIFMGFIIVFSQLLRPIQGVATSIASLQKAEASLVRINEILDADEKIVDCASPQVLSEMKEGIFYKNIHFKYKDQSVLKGFNLTIPVGKTVALVGESGSGKSTIADLLPRFYDVEEGEVCIDGMNIKDISLENLRDNIAIVSQESILFNDSVRNNIAFGMKNVSDADIENAAKIANAHEFIVRLDDGYNTNIGERGNKLSGGQKQRLNIARAVLKNAPILILDEATSALDTESERIVQDALNNLMKERTSIVIAHRLSTIKNADMIIVLSRGEIVEQGTHEELIQLKSLYYNLCNLQGIE